jgi:hypothetical protein
MALPTNMLSLAVRYDGIVGGAFSGCFNGGAQKQFQQSFTRNGNFSSKERNKAFVHQAAAHSLG